MWGKGCCLWLLLGLFGRNLHDFVSARTRRTYNVEDFVWKSVT